MTYCFTDTATSIRALAFAEMLLTGCVFAGPQLVGWLSAAVVADKRCERHLERGSIVSEYVRGLVRRMLAHRTVNNVVCPRDVQRTVSTWLWLTESLRLRLVLKFCECVGVVRAQLAQYAQR